MWKAVAIACCVVTLAVVGMMIVRMDRMTVVLERLTITVDRLMTKVEERMQAGHLYAHWYSAGTPPVLREVDTERGVNEKVADWEARHDAAVAALRATYPPV